MDKLYQDFCKAYKLTQENNDGFFDLVADIYNTPQVQSLAQYEQHLDIDRLQHVTSVAFVAYKVCKKLNLNYKAAARCALMHDLFYYDWRDGETGRWHKLHGYKHPKYARLNAKELCPDITEFELAIISSHMWPLTVIPPKSKEGVVVSLADKYCATREVLYSVNKKYKEKFLEDLKRV